MERSDAEKLSAARQKRKTSNSLLCGVRSSAEQGKQEPSRQASELPIKATSQQWSQAFSHCSRRQEANTEPGPLSYFPHGKAYSWRVRQVCTCRGHLTAEGALTQRLHS